MTSLEWENISNFEPSTDGYPDGGRVDSPSTIREGEEDEYSFELMMKKPPLPVAGHRNTVLTAVADPVNDQALYLWEEGNVPAVTEYAVNDRQYFDDPDFRPYVTSMPVRKGMAAKGAVLLCAGGAFQFRGDYTDTIPTAEALNDLGYHCFVVDYRLRPYTQQEGALDLARAVRFVRKNAEVYGIDPKNIAVMGFSAGGIQAGEMLLYFDGLTDGTALDPDYVPDALDAVSADAAADGMIYSFYGVLSIASKDVEALRGGDLPPTWFCYGTEDPFVREFEANMACLREAGVSVDSLVLQDWPHGYGANGDWVPVYAEWLDTVFKPAGMEEGSMHGAYDKASRVWDVIEDPVFDGYGRLIFPADQNITEDLTLEKMSDILPWYTSINPDRTVEIVNFLHDHVTAGEQIFYDIYTEAEKAADPAKRNTGLFFFRGAPGARVAILNAGGGFAYVGAMHDSFPHALALSKQGYAAFALIYRPGAQSGSEDLARAIAYIHEHAGELQVDQTDYSLWGGSAGARLAAWVGAKGTEAFGEKEYPKPAVVIMQYTGLSEVDGTEAPTYGCAGTNDSIASCEVMTARIDRIRANGTDAVMETFKGLPHGFGLGEGTIAEGWLDRAVAFWEAHED